MSLKLRVITLEYRKLSVMVPKIRKIFFFQANKLFGDGF